MIRITRGISCLLLLLLLLSCQKEALIEKKDYRNNLIGVYEGQLTINNSGIDETGSQLTSPRQIVSYSLLIEKGKTPDRLLLHHNGEKIVLQTRDKKLFEDLLLIESIDCQGTEKYILQFDTTTHKLQLNYTNKSACKQGSFCQKGNFVGKRQVDSL